MHQYVKLIFFIFIILIVTMIQKYNKLEKNINYINNEIKILKNLNKIEKLTVDEPMDAQAMQNLISLAKGGNLTVSSLNITGGLVVNGNTDINGHLSVKKGSEFSGGRHHFQDEENAGKLRVGGAWGIPGIYSEDGKAIVVGNNGIKNIYCNGGETHINNGRLLFKDNRLQNPPGKSELNFGDDGWLRVLNINTGDPNDYKEGGFAGKYLYTAGVNVMSPGELTNNGSRLLHNSSVVRIKHLMRNAYFDNGDGWSNTNVGTNPYMRYELQVI